jgi:hypothetical protein
VARDPRALRGARLNRARHVGVGHLGEHLVPPGQGPLVFWSDALAVEIVPAP